MQSTKNMPEADLRAEITERKLRAFDQAVMMESWPPELLAKAGYKHWSEPISHAQKVNLARLAEWEKNNPA